MDFDISSNDIKIGQYAEITIIVPQKTTGTFDINGTVVNIPLSGIVSHLISGLEIGSYTITATYEGNNYNTVSKSISFTVSEYPSPQWANEGGNTQNTQKSIYDTTTNGKIVFSIPFNETIIGDLMIDSFGNVFIPTQLGIYAFNQTNQLWYFTSTDAVGNLSGIAISRDVIIAPKSGDTLFFINQTSGERFSSNIYQGSSLFAPVVDGDANVYIASEYQFDQVGRSNGYKLVIVPFMLWANGGDPNIIDLDENAPLCAPTLNDDVIIVVSNNRLRFINAKTLETISIKSGNFQPGRPVIGEGSISYVILSNSIVAYNAAGVQVWKTRVTGGVGNVLALDSEQGLYHVNAKGIIYKYDLFNGSEYKFADLKVTSGVLIGNDGTLYFGSNSMFYAMDSEGNVLWNTDLGSKVTGNPVMSKDGIIYVTTEDNKLFALGNETVDVNDTNASDEGNSTPAGNGTGGGNSTPAGNDTNGSTPSNVNPSNGGSNSGTGSTTKIIKKSSKITAKKKTFKKSKKVKKYTVTLKSGKSPIKKVILTIKIGKKTFKAKTNAKGKATFKIKLTKKGRYTAKITFNGNKYYKAATKKVKIVLK